MARRFRTNGTEVQVRALPAFLRFDGRKRNPGCSWSGTHQGQEARETREVRPDGSGTVRLADANPASAPVVDPGYRGDDRDREVMRKGLAVARRIGEGDAFADRRKREAVAGLPAADASVMPSVPSANANATVYAIAERAAELLG
ncbi:GMC oxidoreductase [Streptomyces sp. NPDC002181]|uniref:GMC oxidoreductase n=1 Tax=Streptomyces sp. NPDC002181 TaxID=3364635 RepID=UPI00367EB4FD